MTDKYKDAKTIQGVIDLYKAGHSAREISQLKELKLRTVQDFLHRFKAGGEKQLPLPKKQTGRRKKTCQRTRNFLK